jgi:hypothetical protein
MYLTMLILPFCLVSIESLVQMYVVCGGSEGIILHVPFHIMDHLCMLPYCFRDPKPDRRVIQPWILKKSESLHEVLEVRCPRIVHLVHVSRCVSEIDNSKFQVLKPLEVTSRTKLEFLPVELLKVHVFLGLLERCLHFQKLLEKGFYVLVLFILPSADMPTLLFLTEREKLLIMYLKKNVHGCACHTICPLPSLPVLLDHISIIVTKLIQWSHLMQLLNDNLLPLPPLDPVFSCICSW